MENDILYPNLTKLFQINNKYNDKVGIKSSEHLQNLQNVEDTADLKTSNPPLKLPNTQCSSSQEFKSSS